MALQLVSTNTTPQLPLSDAEKMKIEIKRIKELLDDIKANKITDSTFESLMTSVSFINDIIYTVDNSNDFFKIGGFELLPRLLSLNRPEIRAAAAELIADLLQNNVFCQTRFLETDLPADLVRLVKDDKDVTVCTKALYALSCLCRHNHDAVGHLEKLEALPVLLEVLQRPEEKLKTKAAFLLSDLCSQEPPIRDTLYDIDFISKIIDLLKNEYDTSHEHLLSTLVTLTQFHEKAREQCSKMQSLKEILERNLKFYGTNEEYQESRDYCRTLQKSCFEAESSESQNK